MKNNQKKYFILGIILIVLALLFVFRNTIFKSEESPVENNELKLLQQVFFDKLVVPQNDEGHYIVDMKDYYVKELGDLNEDMRNEFVIMEKMEEGGKNYAFYSADFDIKKIQLLIDNIVDFEWYSGVEDYKNREIEIILKDLTGNNISEIIVPFEKNAKGNRWYQILMFEKKTKKLIKMLNTYHSEPDAKEIIGFDELNIENDFVITVWHGTWSRGKSYYSVEGNILNFEKGIGAYGSPDIEGEYEYREIDKQGNIVYKETRQGSVWTDSLNR